MYNNSYEKVLDNFEYLLNFNVDREIKKNHFKYNFNLTSRLNKITKDTNHINENIKSFIEDKIRENSSNTESILRDIIYFKSAAIFFKITFKEDTNIEVNVYRRNCIINYVFDDFVRNEMYRYYFINIFKDIKQDMKSYSLINIETLIQNDIIFDYNNLLNNSYNNGYLTFFENINNQEGIVNLIEADLLSKVKEKYLNLLFTILILYENNIINLKDFIDIFNTKKNMVTILFNMNINEQDNFKKKLLNYELEVQSYLLSINYCMLMNLNSNEININIEELIPISLKNLIETKFTFLKHYLKI